MATKADLDCHVIRRGGFLAMTDILFYFFVLSNSPFLGKRGLRGANVVIPNRQASAYQLKLRPPKTFGTFGYKSTEKKALY